MRPPVRISRIIPSVVCTLLASSLSIFFWILSRSSVTGDYPLSLEELADIIRKHRELEKKHKRIVEEKEAELDAMKVSMDDWESIRSRIPTWQDVFWNADTTTKRVLVDKLIERIDITRDNINIRFKINLNDFFTLPRITDYHDVPE